MSKLRNIVGLVASLVLVLSCAAHSFVGWKLLRERLAQAGAPPDLRFALGAGWQFAGVAMLAFGIIAGHVFVKRIRGQAISTFPVTVTAVCYLLYGAAAFVISDFDGFFFIFIVPALMLLIGVARSDAARTDPATAP